MIEDPVTIGNTVQGLPETTQQVPIPAQAGASAAEVDQVPERLLVGGVGLDEVDEQQVVRHVIGHWRHGRGGRVVTPNVDIVRLALADPEAAALIAGAELAVTDGVPLLWLARCMGHLRLTRVTGADLIASLSAAAAEAGASVYVLGGPPGAAKRATEALQRQIPELIIAGYSSPPFGFEQDPKAWVAAISEVVAAAPDIVFCGLGFPKQERLAEAVRPMLPRSWFVGCGAAILFASGEVRRAPLWMQRSGLEWSYRLVQEPSRLWRRYLLRDLPFLTRLLLPHLVHRAVHAVPGHRTPPGVESRLP